MNTGTIVLGRFRKCCASVAMGAILAHSGEAVLNEKKINEDTFSETSINEETIITDQWIVMNEFDSSDR